MLNVPGPQRKELGKRRGDMWGKGGIQGGSLHGRYAKPDFLPVPHIHSFPTLFNRVTARLRRSRALENEELVQD